VDERRFDARITIDPGVFTGKGRSDTAEGHGPSVKAGASIALNREGRLTRDGTRRAPLGPLPTTTSQDSGQLANSRVEG